MIISYTVFSRLRLQCFDGRHIIKFQGEMELTPAFYGHMTSMLMNLAGGKVVVVFEVGKI